MNRVRRKWTAEEDKLLRSLITKELEHSRPLLWRELAKQIPGRSNKDCRKRWWNSLSGTNVKGQWSQEEDKRLFEAIWKHGSTNWNKVAIVVGSRNADQCSSHWSQVLNPDINYEDWSAEEDEELLHEVLEFGTEWTKISGIHFPQRTTLALKNRYSTLRSRRHHAGSRRESSSAKTLAPLSNKTMTKTEITQHVHWNCINGDVDEQEMGREERNEGSDDDENEGDSNMNVERCMNRSHSTPWSSVSQAPRNASKFSTSYPVAIGNPYETKAVETWSGYIGASPNEMPYVPPITPTEQWMNDMMDHTIYTSPSFYPSDTCFDSNQSSSRQFVAHDEHSMNQDLGYPGCEVSSNQSSVHGGGAATLAALHPSGRNPLTPESLLRDPRSPTRDSAVCMGGSELHQVSIRLACTEEELRNIMIWLSRMEVTVDIKIGVE